MKELILIGVFVAASALGYVVIRKVPSLLHTPLMSGMNALSGVTLLGALIAGAAAYLDGKTAALLVALLAAALATVNVAGGFSVTHRMLKMFQKRGTEDEK